MVPLLLPKLFRLWIFFELFWYSFWSWCQWWVEPIYWILDRTLERTSFNFLEAKDWFCKYCSFRSFFSWYCCLGVRWRICFLVSLWPRWFCGRRGMDVFFGWTRVIWLRGEKFLFWRLFVRARETALLLWMTCFIIWLAFRSALAAADATASAETFIDVDFPLGKISHIIILRRVIPPKSLLGRRTRRKISAIVFPHNSVAFSPMKVLIFKKQSIDGSVTKAGTRSLHSHKGSSEPLQVIDAFDDVPRSLECPVSSNHGCFG